MNIYEYILYFCCIQYYAFQMCDLNTEYAWHQQPPWMIH